MTVAPHTIRRYVIERASGRTPRPEWSFYEPHIGAWIRADEMTAKRHEHHRPIRVEGRDWCDILGHQTAVRDDLALQTYFLTLDQDDWPRLAAAVREHPSRCLRDWSAAGRRIIAAVSDAPTPSALDMSGPLSGWPAARGDGKRSLLAR